MRLIVLLTMLVFATHAQAQSAGDRAGIEAVITAQIEAFRHDDAAGAFAAAAPNIQARFGTAEHFLDIVRNGYQPVYRPRQYAFGALGPEGDALIQRVEIIGPDGAHEQALYSMVRQADGSWLIAGCALIQSDKLET